MTQFILYCLCGAIGVSTDYLVYVLALMFDVWYQAANILGYVAGTCVSYLLNRRVTFGVHDKALSRFVIFLAVAGIGFTVSSAMLWFLVDYLLMDAKYAKLLTLPVVVFIQFTLNRKFTFDKRTVVESI